MSMVRVSCQTMALCTGLPVFFSQTTVVSRWLVTPIPESSSALMPFFDIEPLITRCLVPDLHRIVLDPSRLGIHLLVLEVIGGYDLAIVAEHHEAGSGGALVDRRSVFLLRHTLPPYEVVFACWGTAARLSLSARSIR